MTSNAIEACKFLKEDIIKIEKIECARDNIARLYMQTANDRLTIASTISQKSSNFFFFLLFISLTLFLVFSTSKRLSLKYTKKNFFYEIN